MSAEVLFDVSGGIARIRLNRPEALNSMSAELMDGLSSALSQAADDTEVRVILLSGEGRGFSSGGDLSKPMDDLPHDDDGRLDLGHIVDTYYNPLVLQMRRLPKPIIAAVHGMAAGAGASIALMADLTIAGRSAYFLQAFVNIGLMPDAGGTWLLPRNAGAQRAMGFALLGERLSAEKALEWGLIWDVVDDVSLVATAMKLAERLAAGPSLALARIKQSIHAAATNTLEAQLDLERDLQRQCGQTLDFREGVAAFLEKREGVFMGT